MHPKVGEILKQIGIFNPRGTIIFSDPECRKEIIATFAAPLWPHSLMDRMEDSGSFDLGSNPGGVTNILVNQ